MLSAKNADFTFYAIFGRTCSDNDVNILNPHDVFDDDQPVKVFIEILISSMLTHGVDLTLAAYFCEFVWKGSAP